MKVCNFEGGCLCGAIRYRAEGQATDGTICHCRTCRKASAAPVVAWVTFALSGFSWLTGTPAEYRSSAPVRRTFCGACGTPLTYAHADSASSIDVTVCSLDEPEAFEPGDHTWVSHKLDWVKITDTLPAYPKTRPPPLA